ncbi:exodeoxyribonuclease V subunit alpha [Rhodanobacter sp. Root561]|uniref:exodeoxyribonuclease V subunit alpha n=1 Tax=Rhodanobacter sp. Root561 TaxID=1736560 RepID=UPI0006FDEECA|nr:exodeoxyribonuclease V subunit alpha [Rhodanobacter sp. Root561]KQZ79494.1 exodeoxyribonuclease V subunit alpha [Rhodanobacter sp. Root561]
MNTPARSYHFRRLAGDVAPPDAWRMLDATVARWVLAHGGSPLLARIAGWASHAEGHGDSALLLNGEAAARHGMRACSDEDIAALRAEPMVALAGDGDAGGTPFVLDPPHFYLRRNYLHETAVARHVRQRRASPLPAGEVDPAAIDALFHGDSDERVQPQRQAVAQVPGKRLFVLTGGPGTGKTTTVLRMLMMLIRERTARMRAAPTIRIGAPTGKAAQRLSESLRDGVARMRAQADAARDFDWQAQLDGALGAEASTLHRLLGSRGRHGGFVHHADNPVPADIVIVDEASMVDLAMLRNLLDALREDAALILVGDADQLTSVGTGSVLLDLVGAMEAEHAPDLVRLSHSFRADQSLVPINEAIRRGDADAFAAAWRAAGDKALRRPLADAQDLARALARWSTALAATLQEAGALDVVAKADQRGVLAALDALRQRQLLCALREGEFGAATANAIIERRLKSRLGVAPDDEWYPGRAVMITRNDYTAGLFNGDVGLCLRDENGNLAIWFEVTVQGAAAIDGETLATGAAHHAGRRAVAFSPAGLPEHQGAFAVTIHKSQGSEYDHVAVLLPPDPQHRILSRQLLYTGMSRARQGVELWAADAACDTALATPVRRASGLAARIA